MELKSMSENTSLSIGLVVALLGCVAYVTTGVSQLGDARARLDKVESKQDQYNATIDQINGKLEEMEVYLKTHKK
jgi:outer membrane murein-binding lipoprotein Lpp